MSMLFLPRNIQLPYNFIDYSAMCGKIILAKEFLYFLNWNILLSNTSERCEGNLKLHYFYKESLWKIQNELKIICRYVFQATKTYGKQNGGCSCALVMLSSLCHFLQ